MYPTQDEENALGNRFTCEIVLGQYRVSSEKMVQSTSAWLKDDAKMITLPKPLVRNYDAKRMLCFKHLDSAGNSLLSTGGAMALSAWLNEAISGIMPEVAPFFIAVVDVPENTRPSTPIAQTIIPQWSSPTSTDENDIALWVIEDSHINMGIIQAIE